MLAFYFMVAGPQKDSEPRRCTRLSLNDWKAALKKTLSFSFFSRFGSQTYEQCCGNHGYYLRCRRTQAANREDILLKAGIFTAFLDLPRYRCKT